MSGKRVAKKEKKALDVALIGTAFFLSVFIVSMVVIFCVKGSTPDVLIQYVLGAGGVEAVMTAAITITKKMKDGGTGSNGTD